MLSNSLAESPCAQPTQTFVSAAVAAFRKRDVAPIAGNVQGTGVSAAGRHGLTSMSTTLVNVAGVADGVADNNDPAAMAFDLAPPG